MGDLIYRTYIRRSLAADPAEVSNMLNGKPVQVEHEVGIDPHYWSDHLKQHAGISLGLPTERHHAILESALERLGYIPE